MQIDSDALSASFQEAVLSLPNIIAAVVIFVVMLFVAALAAKFVQRASQRRGLRIESTLLLSRATRWVHHRRRHRLGAGSGQLQRDRLRGCPGHPGFHHRLCLAGHLQELRGRHPAALATALQHRRRHHGCRLHRQGHRCLDPRHGDAHLRRLAGARSPTPRSTPARLPTSPRPPCAGWRCASASPTPPTWTKRPASRWRRSAPYPTCWATIWRPRSCSTPSAPARSISPSITGSTPGPPRSGSRRIRASRPSRTAFEREGIDIPFPVRTMVMTQSGSNS